jgi:hypothetical protein
LPTSTRSAASRAASASTFGADQAVVQEHVGLVQCAQRVQGQQAGIAGAGTDQATVPGGSSKAVAADGDGLTGECRQGWEIDRTLALITAGNDLPHLADSIRL